MAVARGRGVFIAPEPMKQWFQIPGIVWVPLVDVESMYAAVLWQSGPPCPLVRTLIAAARALSLEVEARAVAGELAVADEAAIQAPEPTFARCFPSIGGSNSNVLAR